MPPKRDMHIVFPSGGVNRRMSHQTQPPFTTPDAENVRPTGTYQSRDRGGSRPGLVKAYSTVMGGAMNARVIGLEHADTAGTALVAVSDVFTQAMEDDTWKVLYDEGADAEIRTIAGFTTATTATLGGGDAVDTSETFWIMPPEYAGKEHADTLTTALKATTSIFKSHMVGWWVWYMDNTIRTIVTYTDGDEVVLDGDARDSQRCFILVRPRHLKMTGTVTSVGAYSAPTTTLTANGFDFTDMDVGSWQVSFAGGNTYPIASVTSSTVVELTGDASAEAGATFVASAADGDDIRMLSSVRMSPAAGTGTWTSVFNETFDSTDQSNWTGAPYDAYEDYYWYAAHVFTKVGEMYASEVIRPTDSDVSTLLTVLETADIYRITTNISVFFVNAGVSSPKGHTLYLKMSETDPDPGINGIAIEIRTYQTDGGTVDNLAYDIQLEVASSGSPLGGGLFTSSAGTLITPGMHDLVVTVVSGLMTISLGELNLLYRIDVSAATAGNLIGLLLKDRNSTDLVSRALSMVVETYEQLTTASFDIPNRLVAASGGASYIDDSANETMDPIATHITLAADKTLRSAEIAGKLYIADTGIGAAGTGDWVLSTKRLVDVPDSSVSDFRDVCNIHDYEVEITNTSGGTLDGGYAITVVEADYIEVESLAEANNSEITYIIGRATKVFDPTASTLAALVSSAGMAPTNCPLITSYQSRLFLGGAPANAHVWYASAIDDPTDWDYGAASAGHAVAGTAVELSVISDPITAMMAYRDDYVIFGCMTNLWVLRGDPGFGGRLVNLSRTIGILGAGGWCFGPQNEMYFLSRDGLYVMLPEATAIASISREAIPEELMDINAVTTDLSMSYDIQGRGFHIYTTPAGAVTATHFWLDYEIPGFWPLSLQSDHHPVSLLNFGADSPSQARVLLGCRDGLIRKYDPSISTDDGTSFTSYVKIGPFAPAGDTREVLISKIDAIIDNSSGDITWEIMVADTHEDTLTALVFASGTFSEGRSLSARPSARGASWLLKLSSTNRWAMEQIVARIMRVGPFLGDS